MKLNELKQGMVCELSGGSKITIVSNEEYVREEYDGTWKLVFNFKDDLTSKDFGIGRDIMKVFYGDTVIWERKESTFWLPEIKEKYYFLDNFGDINDCINANDYWDIKTLKNQIVFKTREEAEKQLLKQQATIRVIKEIARLNEGWLPNWNDGNESKYFIHFSYESDILNYSACFKHKHLDNNLYLKSEELAEQLIETHKQDLKIMLEVE